MGLTRVTLLLRTTMDRQGLDAQLLEPSGHFDGHDGGVIPAETHLRSEWHIRNRILHGLHEIVKQRRASQKPRAGVLFNDLMRGAAEIEIKEVRLHPVAHQTGGLGHRGGRGAEDLDAHRTLAFGEVDHLPGFDVIADEGLGLHELRDHHVGTLLLAHLTESHVGVTSHRGEVERELARAEPRQTWGDLTHGRASFFFRPALSSRQRARRSAICGSAPASPG